MGACRCLWVGDARHRDRRLSHRNSCGNPAGRGGGEPRFWLPRGHAGVRRRRIDHRRFGGMGMGLRLDGGADGSGRNCSVRQSRTSGAPHTSATGAGSGGHRVDPAFGRHSQRCAPGVILGVRGGAVPIFGLHATSGMDRGAFVCRHLQIWRRLAGRHGRAVLRPGRVFSDRNRCCHQGFWVGDDVGWRGAWRGNGRTTWGLAGVVGLRRVAGVVQSGVRRAGLGGVFNADAHGDHQR